MVERPILTFLVAVFLACGSAAAEDKPPKHLADARSLVKKLQLSDTKYEHGAGEIVWTGTVAAKCDCSSFLNLLFAHSYGYAEGDYKSWLGAKRPTAKHYHDTIADPKSDRFARVARLADVKPGDVLAVKYADAMPGENTGHVMLVDAEPKEMAGAPAGVAGAVKQWQVAVIDSSMSAHGAHDSRYEKGVKHTGLGRGAIRVYTNDAGGIVAYTWSPESAKTVYYPKDHDMVVGRLVTK